MQTDKYKNLELLNLFSELVQNTSDKAIVKSDFDYLQNYLEHKGIKSQIICSQNDTPALFAQLNKNPIDLMFIGHLDVVAANVDDWIDNAPFKMIEQGGMLYGRGAVDMKASLAAFTFALCNYKNDCNINIGMLITSDEEGNSLSAQNAAKYFMENNIKIKNILIGEPTSEGLLGDVIKNGRRGSVNFDLCVNGVGGHAAYPGKVINPINIVANILPALTSIDFDDGDDIFDKTHLVVTSVSTGVNARNLVPDSVCLQFNVRFNPKQTVKSIEDKVNIIISNNCVSLFGSGCSYKLSIYSSFDPFYSYNAEFTNLIKEAINEITGITPSLSTSGGTSDGRFFHQFAPIIEFGPLNSTMHKTNECISTNDLYTLHDIYSNILKKL